MNELYDVEIIEKYFEQNLYDNITDLKIIDGLISKCENIKLGVNGDWGIGKTIIAKTIFYSSQYRFNNKNQNYFKQHFPGLIEKKCIYFDASKEDIFQNPLLSLAKIIYEQQRENEKIDCKGVFNSLLRIFSNIPNLDFMTNVAKELKDKEKNDTYIDEYYNTEVIIKKIKELFDSNIKYIILIDELDRCDPRYVLKLLLTIKHFFELNNVSIIYFYNYNELWQLIKKEYGYSNEKYFQKFIDYEINLSKNYESFKTKISNIYDQYAYVCAELFDLSPREINNLKFLIYIHNDTDFDWIDTFFLSHIVIKKEKKETFNFRLLESIKNKIIERKLIRYIGISLDNLQYYFNMKQKHLLEIKYKHLVK